MAKYRKTALIEATQWHKMGDHPAVILKSDPHRYADEGVPWIDTLEGGHVVTPGDWIATGVKGEHWPIKPDVFAASYEPVEASLTPPVANSTGLLWRLHSFLDVAAGEGFVLAGEDAADLFNELEGLLDSQSDSTGDTPTDGVREAARALSDKLHETRPCDLAMGICGVPNFGDELATLDAALSPVCGDGG